MKIPSLPALRAFEVAARHLSFSKAGDELFVTHAAISHQIKKLEEWFDARLFERVGRGVRLTRSGEMLFRQVSPAFADIAEVCGRVKALGGRETLSVGCIPSIASRWLVPNLNLFTSQHPDLDVKVVYATANDRLTGSGLDVLITLGKEDAPDILSTRLFSRIKKPVCSPSFLDAYGPFDMPEKIASAALMHDENRDGWREWFNAANVPWRGEDNWPVYPDFNLLATALVAGHGVALCPIDAFRMEIERGDIVIISDMSINADAAYFASYHKTSTTAASAFLDWFSTFINER